MLYSHSFFVLFCFLWKKPRDPPIDSAWRSSIGRDSRACLIRRNGQKLLDEDVMERRGRKWLQHSIRRKRMELTNFPLPALSRTFRRKSDTAISTSSSALLLLLLLLGAYSNDFRVLYNSFPLILFLSSFLFHVRHTHTESQRKNKVIDDSKLDLVLFIVIYLLWWLFVSFSYFLAHILHVDDRHGWWHARFSVPKKNIIIKWEIRWWWGEGTSDERWDNRKALRVGSIGATRRAGTLVLFLLFVPKNCVYAREREKDSMARQFRVPSENRRTEYNWHITIFSARHQYLYQKRGIQDARDIYMHNMEESSSREW